MEQHSSPVPVQQQPARQSSEGAGGKSSPILIILLVIVFLASSATAAFLYIQNTSLKSQLSQLTATPEVTPTPSVDPTANWKTYTNTSSMYSIKYPADWKIGSVAAGANASQPDPQSRYIQIAPPIDGTGNLGLEELQMIPPSEQASLNITKTINGILLQCNDNFTSDSKTWCWIKVPSQEKYLNLQIFKGTDESVNQTLDQILSTFKFTDSSKASSNIYNSKLGISYAMPSDWKLEKDDGQNMNIIPVTNSNPFAPAINFSVLPNQEQKSFIQLDEEGKKAEMYYGTYDPTRSSLIIDGEKSLYKRDLNCEPLTCDTYAVLHGKQIYQIMNVFVDGASLEAKNNQRKTFDTMLSTFKFTK